METTGTTYQLYKDIIGVQPPWIITSIAIPFAEKRSRFTSRFERAVIVWPQDSPISTVAANFNLSWDEAAAGGKTRPVAPQGKESRKPWRGRNVSSERI